MSIPPVSCNVEVKAPPPRAFELFVEQMSAWWPRGKTPGAKPHVTVVIEPRRNGRWFERDADGQETRWGTVLEYEPPRRLVLGWQLNSQFKFDPGVLSEVEILFQDLPGGGTRVSLEHRDLERLGADARSTAEKIRTGWPARLDNFVQYTSTHT